MFVMDADPERPVDRDDDAAGRLAGRGRAAARCAFVYSESRCPPIAARRCSAPRCGARARGAERPVRRDDARASAARVQRHRAVRRRRRAASWWQRVEPLAAAVADASGAPTLPSARRADARAAAACERWRRAAAARRCRRWRAPRSPRGAQRAVDALPATTRDRLGRASIACSSGSRGPHARDADRRARAARRRPSSASRATRWRARARRILRQPDVRALLPRPADRAGRQRGAGQRCRRGAAHRPAGAARRGRRSGLVGARLQAAAMRPRSSTPYRAQLLRYRARSSRARSRARRCAAPSSPGTDGWWKSSEVQRVHGMKPHFRRADRAHRAVALPVTLQSGNFVSARDAVRSLRSTPSFARRPRARVRPLRSCAGCSARAS